MQQVTTSSADVCTPTRRASPRLRSAPTRQLPKASSTALPYPIPDYETGNPHFWLFAWVEAQAKREAYLHALYDKGPHGIRRARQSEALNMALWSADQLLTKYAGEALKAAIRDGQLLFAWHGTTLIGGVQ